MMEISNEFYLGELTIIGFLVIFEDTASNMEKLAKFLQVSIPISILAIHSKTTGNVSSAVLVPQDGLNWQNQPGPLFLNSIDVKTPFSFKQYTNISWHIPFN